MTTPYRTNPSLGPNLWQVVKKDQAYYEGAGRGAAGAGQAMSPQTGDTSMGDDGRQYMWVQASGTITVAASPGTQVALTVNTSNPRVTAAAGSGGWYAPNTDYYSGTLVAGDRFWVVKGTAP